jgi:methanogenic corrinoid protein MtbC1
MTVYRYVRLGMLPARKTAGDWRVEAADLERLMTPDPAPKNKRSAPWAQRLQARMVAGDDAGSWGVVEAALAAGMAPADFYGDVLTPVLRAIGDSWQSEELGVEDEHLATSVALEIIGRLGPRFARRGRTRGSVVVAMPPGERHHLGVAMVADILRSHGYRVLNLGADTPGAALIAALDEVGDLAAVAVGVVHTGRLGAARSLVDAVHRNSRSVPVLAGGAAVPDHETARRLGADGWAFDAREVPTVIAGLSN